MRFLILFLFTTLSAQIIQTEELSTLERLPLDVETLVVFDVDLVLIESADPLFQYSAIRQNAPRFREIFSGSSRAEQAEIAAVCTVLGETVLVESDAPEQIGSLHARGIPVIACTAMLGADLPGVGDTALSRCRDLASHGITFTQPGDCHLEETDCPFVEGILFTNWTPKGAALAELLARLDWHPKRIIMVDDKLSNLESVAEALEGEMEVIGVHYLRARNAETDPIDPAFLEAYWSGIFAEALEVIQDLEGPVAASQ